MHQKHDSSLFTLHVLQFYLGVVTHFHGTGGNHPVELPFIVVVRIHSPTTDGLRDPFLTKFKLFIDSLNIKVVSPSIPNVTILFGIVPLSLDLSLVGFPLQ